MTAVAGSARGAVPASTRPAGNQPAADCGCATRSRNLGIGPRIGTVRGTARNRRSPRCSDFRDPSPASAASSRASPGATACARHRAAVSRGSGSTAGPAGPGSRTPHAAPGRPRTPTLPARLDVLTGGFPCTDLSAGQAPPASPARPRVWSVTSSRRSGSRVAPAGLLALIENVPNMLVLIDKAGRCTTWTQEINPSATAGRTARWTAVSPVFRSAAVASSRWHPPSLRPAVGAVRRRRRSPQRHRPGRQRVRFLLDGGLRRSRLGPSTRYPPSKGGSTIGIPSPPGIWLPGARRGRWFSNPTSPMPNSCRAFARLDRRVRRRAAPQRAAGSLSGTPSRSASRSGLNGRRTGRSGHRVKRSGTGRGAGRAPLGGRRAILQVAVSEFPGTNHTRHLLDIVDPAYRRGAPVTAPWPGFRGRLQ